jgi:hypothetical protein
MVDLAVLVRPGNIVPHRGVDFFQTSKSALTRVMNRKAVNCAINLLRTDGFVVCWLVNGRMIMVRTRGIRAVSLPGGSAR